MHPSDFELDIEVVVRKVLQSCDVKLAGVRAEVIRRVDQMPSDDPSSAWHTKDCRLLVLMSLMAQTGASPGLLDAMWQEVACGNSAQPDGPPDPTGLRAWHLAWLGAAGKLSRLLGCPDMQAIWASCFVDAAARPYLALLRAVFEGQGGAGVGEVIEALPPVADAHEAKDRLTWLNALLVSRPQDFEPHTALAAVYQGHLASMEQRGLFLQRIEREAGALLAPMLAQVVVEKIYTCEDWWVAIDLLSYAEHDHAPPHVDCLANTCRQSAPALFGDGANLREWIWLGTQLARLVIRRQTSDKAQCVRRLCDGLDGLMWKAQGDLPQTGVSAAYLASWLEPLNALGRMRLSPGASQQVEQVTRSLEQLVFAG